MNEGSGLNVAERRRLWRESDRGRYLASLTVTFSEGEKGFVGGSGSHAFYLLDDESDGPSLAAPHPRIAASIETGDPVISTKGPNRGPYQGIDAILFRPLADAFGRKRMLLSARSLRCEGGGCRFAVSDRSPPAIPLRQSEYVRRSVAGARPDLGNKIRARMELG